MSFDVTVAVSTFGDPSWADLARDRAIPSARALGVPVVHVHGETLHDARNEALARVDTEWVIHLDADDELTAGYIDAMATGTADVRAPAVQYVRPGWDPLKPRVPRVLDHGRPCSKTCLVEGNWVVIGAAARADLLRAVGGWRDWPFYEDWDLWLRCYLAGGLFEAIPAAVYRAHVRPDSRNRAPATSARNAIHVAIHNSACGPWRDAWRADHPDQLAVLAEAGTHTITDLENLGSSSYEVQQVRRRLRAVPR